MPSNYPFEYECRKPLWNTLNVVEVVDFLRSYGHCGMLENLSTLQNVVEVVKKVAEVAEWMVATKDENLMPLLKNI